jgi:hypothetical protein
MRSAMVAAIIALGAGAAIVGLPTAHAANALPASPPAQTLTPVATALRRPGRHGPASPRARRHRHSRLEPRRGAHGPRIPRRGSSRSVPSLPSITLRAEPVAMIRRLRPAAPVEPARGARGPPRGRPAFSRCFPPTRPLIRADARPSHPTASTRPRFPLLVPIGTGATVGHSADAGAPASRVRRAHLPTLVRDHHASQTFRSRSRRRGPGARDRPARPRR